jgi:hypothetical protein
VTEHLLDHGQDVRILDAVELAASVAARGDQAAARNWQVVDYRDDG